MNSAYRPTIVNGVETIRLDTPLHAQIELTSCCIYDCYFCYNVWKSKTPVSHVSLDREQAKFVASELIKCKIFSVVLSGGEPTLQDYLPEITDMFSSAEVRVSMITNGSLLTTPLIKSLKQNGLEYVQISIHHYNEDAFN